MWIEVKQMFIQAAWEFLPETLRGYYWCRSNGSLLQRDCTLASLWRTAASISPVAPSFCSELDLGHININFIFPDTARDNSETISIAILCHSLHMSHFAYACKMRYLLNLVLESWQYLWFYWTFCIVILDYGLKLHKLLNHTLVMIQKWLEIH